MLGITWATIFALLALLQFMYFGMAVGRARGRHGIDAPAVTGDETFERFHRAHQNTLEQLVVFIPAIYASAYFAHAWLAIAGGVAFLLGRAWYFRSYIAEPGSRGPGMMLTFGASAIMIVAALVGAVSNLLA